MIKYPYDLCACGKRKRTRSVVCGPCNLSKGHGHTGSLTHVSWAGMKHRCASPNTIGWKNYGGKGIKVCERWLKFENFLADMGERPSKAMTLDRIDNDKNYEPGNCRWVDWFEQARNRKSLIHDLTGGTYGRLTAMKVVKTGKRAKWICRCECGNESIVGSNNLTNGHTRSCGCINRKLSAKDLDDIRTKLKQNIMGAHIAKQYGVDKSLIYRIRDAANEARQARRANGSLE